MHRSLLSIVLSLSVLLSTLVAAQSASYTFTTIDVPFSGATASVANGINNSGQIVGIYGSLSGGHGFLYDAGGFTHIDVPGANNTNPSGINDDGQIVGYYSVGFDSEFRPHGFLYVAGVFTPLDVPDATHTQAFGINNRGQIVGTYTDSSGGQHGFVATPTKK
jgi:probable HAF family extracellular repeat protein